MIVIEAKDAPAEGGELLDSCPQVFSKFLAEDVLTRTRKRVCDAVFGYQMHRVGVAVFLLSEVIYTDVFGDAVKP